jgi:hypothetical protein
MTPRLFMGRGVVTSITPGVNDMAAKKKRKAGPAKKKKTVKAKKAAKEASKKAAKKPKRAVAKKATKAAAKKSPAKKAKAAPKKKAGKRKTIGEGNYAASRRFDKDEASFVKKNKAAIPAMGKEAEKALDGPEGAELRDAEATAAARSRDIF